MHYIKKMCLAAALAALSLTAAFPALAEEPVGKDVTVVETAVVEETAAAQDPAELSVSETQSSHKSRASVSFKEDYINQGPGVKKKEEEPPAPKEVSLGRFSITGYCGCEQCSSGHGLTYSGVVPTPGHTISADLNKFPLGTRLKIDGTVYTVEDKGSSVNGNMLDIYYGSHQEALAKGTYSAEVFLVQN